MDWDKLRVFHAVAEAGSFTHAGETLNLSQSAVSRQIGALEDTLKVPLFHRHARGLILTEQGEMLFKTTRDVFAKLATTQALLTESTDRPKGPLKIATTVAFGSIWLTPRMKEFLELYPDIAVTILLGEGEVDLAMREADVAIRLHPPQQPDLIQRRLTTMHLHVYASPDYLKHHPMPQSPEDLAQHVLVVYGEDVRPPVTNINWLQDLVRSKHIKPPSILKVNSIYAQYRAVVTGVGIASLPDYAVKQYSSNLVRILPDLEGPSFDTYFVYPEELRHSKRVSVFRDFLVRKIAETDF
ncbi:MAG TPA: LysR family transcriptional regulator [Alphaproteobacteria bacterium]|nr:LysR family transcriptional regulator [Alphaproteobacteria bacterium]